MSRIECLTQIEYELYYLDCKLTSFKTREGVIEINFIDKELNNCKFYVPYRFLTSKQLHDNIRRWVLE